MAVLKTDFYSNSTDTLGNALAIMEISRLLLYSFIPEKHYMNTENGNQPNPARGTHKLHTPQTSMSCVSYEP